MNTVLFSSAPDSSTALKSNPARPASDSNPRDNDSSAFAGVLASQAVPPVQQTGTASAATAAHADPGASPKAHGATASQHSAQNQGNSDVRDSTAARQNGQTEARPTHGHHSRVLDPTATFDRPATDIAHAIKEGADATLPQRFAQIIAAMEQTGQRHTGQPLDGKIARTDRSAPSDDATRPTLADARSRLSDNAKRAGFADGARTSANRNTGFDGTPDTTRRALPAGQFTANGDPASFNLNEPYRLHTESQPDRTVQAPLNTPDALLNPVAGGAGFSLIPGSVYGSDIQTLSATISQPLFSTRWGPEMGKQFVSLIRPGENGSHIAELRLDPPELGPLRVTININDSVIQAIFTSAHANVRNAVEQALPQLQQQLEQEGLSLGQTSVGHDDGTSPAHPDPVQASLTGSRNDASVPTTAEPSHRRVPDALVDTFA